MFGWFKKEITPYQILVNRGKEYLKLSKISTKKAKEYAGYGYTHVAKENMMFAEECEKKAIEAFQEAHKFLRNDEPEDLSVRNYIDAETYR